MTLIGNTITRLFITTRLHHRSDHQYIATISVRRGGLRHNAIWKQGDTWSGRLLDILTQWYGLVESLHGGNYNKENIAAAIMVNIIEDILLPDKTSIFFLLDDAINLFWPKDRQTVVTAMKWLTSLWFLVAQNEVPVHIVIELHSTLVSKAVRYNNHIWCHYIGFSLNIQIFFTDY